VGTSSSYDIPVTVQQRVDGLVAKYYRNPDPTIIERIRRLTLYGWWKDLDRREQHQAASTWIKWWGLDTLQIVDPEYYETRRSSKQRVGRTARPEA
jgi:hypothetical protein